MIADALLTEAVAAVRVGALCGDRTYEGLAIEVVAHRMANASTYGWPEIPFRDALLVARAIADRARAEDLEPRVRMCGPAVCRCGEAPACEHDDDMGGERAWEQDYGRESVEGAGR